jgi:hypothetical protein
MGKQFNATPQEDMVLTEGSLYYIVDTYTIDNVAQDISGGSFVMNLLDKEGGSIIDTITVDYVTDGTDGAFDETYTIAELDAVLAAYDAGTGELPSYYELFFSSDGTAANYTILWAGRVQVDRSGD